MPGDRLGVKSFENVLVEYPGLQDIYFLAWPFDSDLMVGFVGGEFGWRCCRLLGWAHGWSSAADCRHDNPGKRPGRKLRRSSRHAQQ